MEYVTLDELRAWVRKVIEKKSSTEEIDLLLKMTKAAITDVNKQLEDATLELGQCPFNKPVCFAVPHPMPSPHFIYSLLFTCH